jgi:hypothetical protein
MITENKLYNPAGQTKEWLIEHFVVRTKVFEKLFNDIRSSEMKYPEQHYLIQGQRGMGKTTLLLRLKYEIESTPELDSWLIPVFFNEESYDLTSLSNLWEKLLKYLDALWQTGGVNYQKTDSYMGHSDYEKKCFELLLQVLNVKRKKLIIFFDNFGQLFLDNLKEKEQHRLREILMGCAELRIIGASAVVLKDLHDYSKPFFEFFKIINLEGLNKTETFQLIKKLQEKSGAALDIEKNKAKIETLAILSGGVIRTIMLIYEVILADQDGSALRDLETILDRITPLYKHRIEDLPIQQRRIVDVIAKNWDAISSKDIASNIREDGQLLATKIISAQLQQLEKNNVIEKKQTTTKNHLYQLKERFFNIWYLMRLGDKNDRRKVIWLTKFLEIWYEDKDGFNSFVKKYIDLLKTGGYNLDSAVLMTEALANSERLDLATFNLLINETSEVFKINTKKLPDIYNRKAEISNLLNENKYPELIDLLTSSKNMNSVGHSLLVYSYVQNKEYSKAAEFIDKIEPTTPEEYYLLGSSYFRLKEYRKAIDIFEKYNGTNRGGGFFYIGESYWLLKEKDKAILYFKKAISLNENRAYQSLILILFTLERWEEAEEIGLKGIKIGISGVKKALTLIYLFSEVKGHREKGKKIIDTELESFPENPDFNYLMGTYHYFEENERDRSLEENGRDRSLSYFLKANEFYIKKELNVSSIEYNFNLFLLLSILIDKKDKKSALEILSKVVEIVPGSNIELQKAFVDIWNSNYEGGVLILKNKSSIQTDNEKIDNQLINDILLLLLAKRQYNTVLQLFNKENPLLKELFKPTYYLLMHYLKDEYPNEIIKMGEELKQPVEDIMKRVEEMAVDYK